jgi:hypothetical protein
MQMAAASHQEKSDFWGKIAGFLQGIKTPPIFPGGGWLRSAIAAGAQFPGLQGRMVFPEVIEKNREKGEKGKRISPLAG